MEKTWQYEPRNKQRRRMDMTVDTRSASTEANPTAQLISQLRDAIDGRVIAPSDAEYDRARSVFYGVVDRRPAAIVRVANASDVSRVISAARETGLELAVRSGGHSFAGHSVTDGGIVLDLSEM